MSAPLESVIDTDIMDGMLAGTACQLETPAPGHFIRILKK